MKQKTLIILLTVLLMSLLAACTTRSQTEAEYKSKFVYYYSDGKEWQSTRVSGSITNIYNDSLTIEAIKIFKGSMSIWIKEIDPNESIDIFYRSDAVRYIVYHKGEKKELIYPNYMVKTKGD